MKTIRTSISVLLLAVTLVFTIAAAFPVHAGSPTPDVACEGQVCDFKLSCAPYDPSSPMWVCTNLCYDAGGRPRCYGTSYCTVAC